MNAEDLVCETCLERADFKCGRCRRASYCSKEHQRIDWKSHKTRCRGDDDPPCFEVRENEKLGRYIVATRFIAEGTVILQDSPLVRGPTLSVTPVCLGCYVPFSWITSWSCSRCGWPLCSEACEKSSDHRVECEAMAERKAKVSTETLQEWQEPLFGYMLVLRCLYLKFTDPAAWDEINRLESHTAMIMSSRKWGQQGLLAAAFVRDFLKFQEFTVDEVTKVFSLLIVNGQSVPAEGETKCVALYGVSSMAEHSCRANSQKIFTSDGTMAVVSGMDIQRGEHISMTYTHPFRGVQERRLKLLDSKFFLCECERCADPTELGTHFNSFRCRVTRGCTGYVAPHEQSRPRTTLWACDVCKEEDSNEYLSRERSSLEAEVDSLDKTDWDSCMRFLDARSVRLSPRHNLILRVKYEMSETNPRDASLEDLLWMVEALNEIVSVSSLLMPAEKKLTGRVLFRLAFYQNEVLNRKTLAGSLDPIQISTELKRLRDTARRSYEHLRYGALLADEKKAMESMLKMYRDIGLFCYLTR